MCDLETSRIGAPYIYDISNLRVKVRFVPTVETIKYRLSDKGADRRIILKLIFMKWDVGTDWIDLAQDRCSWRELVNAVMNLLIP